MNTTMVKNGYNTIAERYLKARDLGSEKYVRKLMRHLSKGSTIFDVGCGAGVPVDDLLIKAGHFVKGIDIAENQIKKARKLCPAGEYWVMDVLDYEAGEEKVDAIVCLYTLFHVPRGRHGEVIRTFSDSLTRGGLILITMGDVEFEGITDFHGAKMWWSQWGREKNLQLVRQAGFQLIEEEIDVTGGERHQIILARKKA